MTPKQKAAANRACAEFVGMTVRKSLVDDTRYICEDVVGGALPDLWQSADFREQVEERLERGGFGQIVSVYRVSAGWYGRWVYGEVHTCGPFNTRAEARATGIAAAVEAVQKEVRTCSV